MYHFQCLGLPGRSLTTHLAEPPYTPYPEIDLKSSGSECSTYVQPQYLWFATCQKQNEGFTISSLAFFSKDEFLKHPSNMHHHAQLFWSSTKWQASIEWVGLPTLRTIYYVLCAKLVPTCHETIFSPPNCQPYIQKNPVAYVVSFGKYHPPIQQLGGTASLTRADGWAIGDFIGKNSGNGPWISQRSWFGWLRESLQVEKDEKYGT